MQEFDITIIGAGPAGLSFACAVAESGLNVAIIDPKSEADLQAPPYDGREIAVTHGSEAILSKLGVWNRIDDHHKSRMRKAHVINGDEPYALKFTAAEAGTDYIGTLVPNQQIRETLFAQAKTHKNITWLTGNSVKGLKAGTVTLTSGKTLSTQLTVAADGRMSRARQMMGISASMKDLGRTVIVGLMSCKGDHENTAFECFHYDRTLAVLPLTGNRVSVVITLPSSQAQSVLDMDPADFARDLEERFEQRIGAMERMGDLYSYPLLCNYAAKFSDDRFALLGDAAVGMHPVTAHGFNLGLGGGALLADKITDTVKTGGDIREPLLLQSYNRQHQLKCWPLYWGTNVVERLFTNTSKPAKLARKSLLRLGNILKPANKIILNQLTEKKG